MSQPSRAPIPATDTRELTWQFTSLPEFVLLCGPDTPFEDASPDIIDAILAEAAKFAADRLDPLNALGEHQPSVKSGNIAALPDMHKQVWREFADSGWIGIDLPADYGGQALPLALSMMCQALFDRHNPAFGMLAVSARSAVKLLGAYAPDTVKAEWIPHLISGRWGATICISEVEAGSDVRRMRTSAVPGKDGMWSITGEKQWISFGSHDLTKRIGHCLLAQTRDGISLFLVPNHFDGEPNGIALRRVEEKLGLHLSPTCALGFEDSRGYLLGEPGRGLQQMFVMITNMRLAVGSMGLGIAKAAADLCLEYAQSRRQGGRDELPLPIIAHADVARMVLSTQSRAWVFTELMLTMAMQADLAKMDTGSDEDARDVLAWCLPIIKFLGGDWAVKNSGDAMQVFGGAGYTADWPTEQLLRDARILPIFEGTTGIQALDLVHRQLIRTHGGSLNAFTARVGRDLAGLNAAHRDIVQTVMDRLKGAADALRQGDDMAAIDFGSTAFLELAGEAAMCWAAGRLVLRAQEADLPRAGAAARFWLSGAQARSAQFVQAAAPNAAFKDLVNSFISDS